MRTYERNGVHVDQCGECRGIFLDRGELERLVDAENSWHTPAAASSPEPPRHQGAGQEGAGTSSLGAVVGEVLQQARQRQTGGQQHRSDHYGKPRKKKSFLDELFG